MRANEVKKEIHFFTIADYKEEEIYLREQHKKGLKPTRFVLPCFYYFEKCEPEDVIYQLDFSNGESRNQEYIQIYQDTGWEYLFDVNGWSYFRKPAAETDGEEEIYSDKESKVMHVDKIVKRRMLPLLVIFLCCVIPNFLRYAWYGRDLIQYGWGEAVMIILWYVIFFAYVWLVTHCVRKLRHLKAEIQNGKI